MPFTPEQRQNAAVIIRVGNQVGASARDILIALMTAMQESGLRNLDYGDRDSVGLFQQRTSQSWGSVQQIMNPEYAARAFFLGAGTNSGLLDLGSRNSMSLSQAAQAVQRSAYPDAYAKHEGGARGLLESLGDGTSLPGTLGRTPGRTPEIPTGPTLGQALTDTLGDHPALAEAPTEVDALGNITNAALGDASNSALGEVSNSALSTASFDSPMGAPPEVPGLADSMKLPNVDELMGFNPGTVDIEMGGWRGSVVDLARNFLGTPYVWGGASPTGFDCSGLIQYIYAKQGIDLPRISADQARSGRRVALDKLKPGDLVAWDNSSRNNGADHIAIYIGNGRIIHAPRPGASVEISTIFDRGSAWGVAMS